MPDFSSAFLSSINLKLHNIHITVKLVNKIIINIGLWKMVSRDCVPAMFRKNYEPEFSDMLAELLNMLLKESSFPDFWRYYLWFPYLWMLLKGLLLNSTSFLVSFLWLVKCLESLEAGFLITLKNVAFLSDFQYGPQISSLGPLDIQQIFWQLYLLKLPGLLISLVFLKLQHVAYVKISTGFGMLVLFTSIRLVEFLISFLALFCLFLVICSFKWFCMGSLSKNIQLILLFLKAPLLVLHFPTIPQWLSMLIILLSTLSMIRHPTTRGGFWTWVWPTKNCGLWLKVGW